jgi:hypothetical protein
VVRLFSGVRAVLGRPDIVVSHRETDRLAATLALYWAGDADPGSPLGRFVQTGAISEATVDALYEDLVRLERAAGSDSSPRRGGEWTTQAVVRALLEYAAVHRPRGPVPDWKALRDDHTAARVFRQLPSERP